MNKTISNQNKAVKSETGRTFIASRAAGDKMEELNGCDEFSLVRNQKGQLYIRISRMECRQKDGIWRKLPWSGNPDKDKKRGWGIKPSRIRYEMTPVTRQQAIKWLIKEEVPEEFQPDLLAAMHKQSGKRQIIIELTKEQYKLVEKLCQPYRVTPEEVAMSAFVHQLYQDEDQWHFILEQATEAKKIGIHPAWDSLTEELKFMIELKKRHTTTAVA